MNISDVIKAALASSAMWLFAFIVMILFSSLFGNGLYGAMVTFVLYTAWISGMGILIQMKKRA